MRLDAGVRNAPPSIERSGRPISDPSRPMQPDRHPTWPATATATRPPKVIRARPLAKRCGIDRFTFPIDCALVEGGR